MPPNTVKVDRSTRWGNPFKAQGDYSAQEAVEDFRRWIFRELPPLTLADVSGRQLLTVEIIRTHLKYKNLACWCPVGTPCHGEVLLAIANELTAS